MTTRGTTVVILDIPDPETSDVLCFNALNEPNAEGGHYR